MCTVDGRVEHTFSPDLHKGTCTHKDIHVHEKMHTKHYFLLRVAFHMFINMIISRLENPQAVPALPLEMFHF